MAELELAEYDPAWAERFEVEAALIEGAFGEAARQIEHVGSTSVPGLAGKPTVDIAVGVDRLDVVSLYVGPMTTGASYINRTRTGPGNDGSSRAIGSPGK